jgi:hypothetical protein
MLILSFVDPDSKRPITMAVKFYKMTG